MFKPHVLRGFFHHPRTAELAHSHTTCGTPKFVKTPKVSKRAETKGRRGVLRKSLPTPHCLKQVQNSSATHQNVLCAAFFVTSPHRRGKMRHKMHQIMPKTPLQLVRMSSARAFFVVCEAGSSKSRQKLIRNSSAECLRDQHPKNTCQKLLCKLSAHNPPTQKELPRRTF